MRLVVVLSAVALGAVFACAAAPIGSLDGSGVGLPDRTSEDDGDASGTTPADNGSTAVLTVTLAGAGTVTSAPAGLTCTATTCTGTYAVGTAVSLAATPSAGGTFSGWTGACTGASCTVTVTADTAVTATFGALSGTWKGLYENKRKNSQTNCDFDNKGNLTLTTASDGDAGASVKLTAAMDGMEIRDQDCNRVGGTVSGDSSKTNNNNATVAAGALTGQWTVNAGQFGNLDFPFKATISGNTMTGQWTCATCTGTFTLTKQP